MQVKQEHGDDINESIPIEKKIDLNSTKAVQSNIHTKFEEKKVKPVKTLISSMKKKIIKPDIGKK